ncbi:MAG: Na+/H+ antiporter NhaC [Crocinitomicaceae bacterium]|nr:Na+/H+ antiporter NhaC [Crocinitomicaceae bacterium]
MESNSIEEKKESSLLLALIPMLSMVVLIGVGNLWMGIDLKFILLLCALIAGGVARYAGVTVDQMIAAIGTVFKKAFPVVLILIAIGGIVGTWIYSGTVPYLIYYGLKVLHPDYLLVTTFIVTAAVSTFTGTSYGSAATAGVAFMGIGWSMGIPAPMVAGAVISGAVFGDKISPVSDTTNVSAISANITVYQHIRGMLPNVLISAAIAIVAFTILGLYNGGSAVINDDVQGIITDLEGMFNFNLFMLLPAIIVFVGGYKGYNPVVLMIFSSLIAIVIGAISNGFGMQDGAVAMISGFNVSMFDSDVINPNNISDKLTLLLNRGGFNGMMSGAVLFCVLSISFGAIMETYGALTKLANLLLKRVRSTFGLIVSAFFSGAILNGISGSAMFSMLTIGQLFTQPFKNRNVPAPVLSRSMENSMTLLESLLPWHTTGAYMALTLGIGTLEYLPYAFFNIIGIALFFVLSYRTVGKLKL